MNNSSSKNDSLNAAGIFDKFAIGLLLVHFYAVCYAAFQPQVFLGKLTNVLYTICQRLPFLFDGARVKSLVVLLLALSFFQTPPSQNKTGWVAPLLTLGIGLGFFYGAGTFLPIDADKYQAYGYLILATIGFLVIIAGMGRLARALRYAFHARQFEPDTTGFRQEEQLITTSHSINFRARYIYNAKQRKSFINVINPRRGVLIMGFPGSGKSWFIIEPAIEQLAQKGKALFVYDFKYPVLTRFTYNSYMRNRKGYPGSTRFYSINFTDLPRSYRCNLIDPKNLEYSSDAMAVSRTILLSMNKDWVSKQGHFFVESPIAYLAGLIWFLKVYKNGIYCTLPHAIELSKIPYEELFTLLCAEPATSGIIGPYRDAYLNNSQEMLDGQTISARVPLIQLDSPDIYYVLSGNDLSLKINDPYAPAILCLGGDSTRHYAFAPIMSLYIDRINRLINHPNGYPVALVVDEFATVRATSILDIMATGRSNDITPILVVQDLSQLRQRYSHDEADQIMNTAGNLFCGQLVGETAKWISQRFEGILSLRTTISVNSSDISTSKTGQTVDAITPSTLANLSSGEFVGLTADDPDKKIKLKGFHATIVKDADHPGEEFDLPIVHDIDREAIRENYTLIRQQITSMVKEEM